MKTTSMSFAKFVVVLKARWPSAMLVLLTVVTVVVSGSLLLSPKYTATASVVLDVKLPDPIAGVVLPGMSTSGYMATQIDVLKSERVALRAIQALQLDQRTELRERWQTETDAIGDFHTWLAELVMRRLDVKPTRDSNVLTVAYTSPDRLYASAMANAFVKAYVDTTLDLRVEPAKQYNSFFDDRAKQLRDAVEHAQAKLSAYQQQKGIVATDEKLDVENARLTELSTQLVSLQGVANESVSRQDQTKVTPDQMKEVLDSPLVSSLTTELSRLEARLHELSPRLGDQHPQVLELRAGIAQVSARVESEKRRVLGSVVANNSVNAARVTQLRASLDQQRSKVLRLKEQRDEAAVLQRDVENAQRAHDAMVARVNQASIESQNPQTNVSVLKKATPPVIPSSPRVLLNTAVAIVLGVLLAIGTALVRELRDTRLRTDDDVMLVLKQPLLGALPVRALRNGAGRSRVQLLKGRILGALPHPIKPTPVPR